jgi:phosphoglycolate phosphatase
MSYRLIILDFDGTLCATHQAIVYCVQQAYERHNFPSPDAAAVESGIHLGLGMENMLKELSPTLRPGDIRLLLESYEQIYLDEGEAKSFPFDDARTVLDQLHHAGKILTVISNKALAAVRASLERFELRQYIQIIVGDEPHLPKKPDPTSYFTIIQPAFPKILPTEILMVGDTPADLLFARNIGALSCWARYGYGVAQDCLDLNPDYSISRLRDLITIVAG